MPLAAQLRIMAIYLRIRAKHMHARVSMNTRKTWQISCSTVASAPPDDDDGRTVWDECGKVFRHHDETINKQLSDYCNNICNVLDV